MHRVLTAADLYLGQQISLDYRGTNTDATVTGIERHTNRLGGRWATVDLTLPEGTPVTVDSRSHVLTSRAVIVPAWCPECRARVQVADSHQEGHYEGRYEYGYLVQDLTCGHTLQGPETVVGASPGGDSAAEAAEQTATADRLARSAALQDTRNE